MQRPCTLLPPVFKYSNFRDFLLSYVDVKKQKQPGWSLGVWAKQLGLCSTSSLSKILTGERNPGSRMVEKFAKYFIFSSEEERHFREMIQIEKHRSTPELVSLLVKTLADKGAKREVVVLDSATFSRISEWHYFAIREMTHLEDFVENPEWISQRLGQRVSPSQVKIAIERMLEVGLLGRLPGGKLEVRNWHVDTQGDLASEAVKRYHERSLEHAKTAIRSVPTDKREYVSSVFGVSESNLPLAKQLIREFRDKFVQSIAAKPGEEVYQLETVFFPLTTQLRGPSNENTTH